MFSHNWNIKRLLIIATLIFFNNNIFDKNPCKIQVSKILIYCKKTMLLKNLGLGKFKTHVCFYYNQWLEVVSWIIGIKNVKDLGIKYESLQRS